MALRTSLPRLVEAVITVCSVIFVCTNPRVLIAASGADENRLHVVMILADGDPAIGPTVLFDARLIAAALGKAIPRPVLTNRSPP